MARCQIGRPLKLRDTPPRARWFAAEFLVVVAGILVAFALQVWPRPHLVRAYDAPTPEMNV